jgi:hypothetical protein
MTVAGGPGGGWANALWSLRQVADTSAIRASEGSVSWLSAASSVALNDAGVLAALGPNRLSSLNRGLIRTDAQIDGTALVLAAVAVSAARLRKTFSFPIAPGARHLPLLIATVAILGDTVRGKCFGEMDGEGVLLVSPDLDLRAKYSTLQIGSASIDAVHPGCTLNAFGRLTYISKSANGTGRRGVCFMYPTKRLPDEVDLSPRYVFLDFRYGRESARFPALLKWAESMFPYAGVVVLHTTGDDLAERELSTSTGALFSFEHQAVATCDNQLVRASLPVPDELTESAMSAALSDALRWIARSNEIRCLQHAEKLEEFFASLQRSLFSEGHYNDPAIRRATWLYSTLRDFPIPLEYYERSAQSVGKYTLKRMIDGLQSLQRDPAIAPLLQSLHVLFQEIYKLLLSESPRGIGLQEAIEDAFLSQDDPIVLLCKDATAAIALDLWLNDILGTELQLLSRVSEVKFADAWMLQSRRVGVAIVSGVLPTQHRWLYGANLGKTAIHLCAPAQLSSLQRALELPFSSASNSKHVDSRYRLLSRVLDREVVASGKDTSLGRLRVSGAPDTKHDGVNQPPPAQGEVVSAQKAPAKQKLRSIGRGLESLGALMAEFGKVNVSDAPAPMATTPPAQIEFFDADEPDDGEELHEFRATRGVTGLRDSERVLVYLDELRYYEVIPHGEKARLAYMQPSQLTPGDIVLVADSLGRMNVFDQMLSIIEGGPALKSLASYRRAWSAVLRRLKYEGTSEGRIDFALLLKKLQAQGADIESELTVRNWITGSVIGPAKVTSIRAVGQLIGANDMVERATEYDIAFRTIRSIHQTLGKQISRFLRSAIRDYGGEEPVDIPDEHAAFALPLRELLQTIVPIEVEYVDENPSNKAAGLLHQPTPA